MGVAQGAPEGLRGVNPNAAASAEARQEGPASAWKRTALVVAAAVSVGVLMRWVLAPHPYPLGLDTPEWFPLRRKLLPVIMKLLARDAPWVVAACVAAVKMPRRKWLWAIACAVGAAVVYHLSGGALFKIALPPMPDLNSPMSRLSIVADVLADGRSFAPPWRIVLIGAAYEMLFALVLRQPSIRG